MSPNSGLRRRFADATCLLLRAILPNHLRPWGDAIRAEVAQIPSDTEALFYALGGIGGLLPRAVAAHLFSPVDEFQSYQQSASERSAPMLQAEEGVFRPRWFALACGASAVLLGLFYLASAGAPARYLVMNGAAFLIGFAALAVADRLENAFSAWRPVVVLASAAALIATSLLGQQLEGVARWVRVGSLSVQPSLILLPIMILAFARTRSWLSTAGIVAAAAALAIQPDRAMGGVLAAGVITLAVLRPDRMTFTAAAAAVAGFAVTLVRPDQLPAAPYVDQILYSAFDVHLLAGVSVLAGSVLLVAPAIAGWVRDAADRTVYAVLGVTWLMTILAAALGNYPTPIVGYGGSAIIGYLLCLVALPKTAATSRGDKPYEVSDAGKPRVGDQNFRAAQSSA